VWEPYVATIEALQAGYRKCRHFADRNPVAAATFGLVGVFAYLRIGDILFYWPFTVQPSDVGRTYEQTLTQSFPLVVVVLLPSVVLMAAFFTTAYLVVGVGFVCAGKGLTALSGRLLYRGTRNATSGPGWSPNLRALRNIYFFIAAVSLPFVALLPFLVLGLAAESSCADLGWGDDLGGWDLAKVETITAIDPESPNIDSSDTLRLGSHSNTSVFYQCTTKEVIRLPSSSYVVITRADRQVTG